ncbi:MAG: hypothetical protein K1X92_18900, partial [Bacteroidia bacterium]|nr:hypothetical protein [Bacteroidia bacterium]
RFKPDFGNNYQWWPEVEFSKNPTNPQKYGYTGIPMMCYGDDEKKEIWIFEYQELIRQTLLYVEIFMQKVYNQDYKKFSIQKYYIKRRSRIVFWDNIQ